MAARAGAAVRREALVRSLLDRHGQTYAAAAGIRLGNTPGPLFQLLCLSILLSARIKAEIAVAAATALADRGWRTPQKLAAATWAQRAQVLNRAGYARYDERTSTMLGEAAALVTDRWHGDLRRLREEAERRPDEERRLLQQVKGIGRVGADIFCREAQGVWDELQPFVDGRALEAADKLGLGRDAKAVAGLVPSSQLPVLVAALVRLSLARDYEEIRAAAER